MTFKTLTVGELIKQLAQFPDNMPVIAVADYGDRQNTMQAIPVTNLLDGFSVTSTFYSKTGYKCVNSWDKVTFYEFELPNVVVLNSGDID